MGIGKCWLGVTFSRIPPLYVQAYLDDSVGLGSVNVGRMGELLQFAKSLRKFIVVGADFNATPEEMTLALDLDEAGLTIVVPSNADITCTSGRGRLTSFFLVSTALLTAVRGCEAVDVPWGTHLGIRLQLAFELEVLRYRSIALPARFEL